MTCPVCGAPLHLGLLPWHVVCRHCAYEGSTLEPHITEQAIGGDLDEHARHIALEPLRKGNFRRLRMWITDWFRAGRHAATGERPSLLDVGCAHGWFLDECSGEFDTAGIEPDAAVARAAARRGVAAREGFFPEVLRPQEKFDVIVFNDVLEHIPPVHATFKACADHLHGGGLLVVNAPSSKGVIYRASKLLARLGLPASFERMWQKGFPSPHVHYFDTETIASLANRHGFQLVARHRLRSVSTRGLYSRIRYSGDVPAVKAAFLTMAMTIASPLLAFLPPDIEVWFLQLDGGNPFDG